MACPTGDEITFRKKGAMVGRDPAAMSLDEAAAAAKEMAFEDGPGAFPALGADLLQRRGRILDLSRPIFEGMPQWFGHQKTFTPTNQDHEGFREIWKTDPGFEARNLIMSEHCGTHTDAIIEVRREGSAPRQDPARVLLGRGRLSRHVAREVPGSGPRRQGLRRCRCDPASRGEAGGERRGDPPRGHRDPLVRPW